MEDSDSKCGVVCISHALSPMSAGESLLTNLDVQLVNFTNGFG